MILKDARARCLQALAGAGVLCLPTRLGLESLAQHCYERQRFSALTFYGATPNRSEPRDRRYAHGPILTACCSLSAPPNREAPRSGMIKGIDPIYAKKLVRAFGEAVFDVVAGDPKRLQEVDGISRTASRADRTLRRNCRTQVNVLLSEDRRLGSLRFEMMATKATAAVADSDRSNAVSNNE
jgi:hypothetical protein